MPNSTAPAPSRTSPAGQPPHSATRPPSPTAGAGPTAGPTRWDRRRGATGALASLLAVAVALALTSTPLEAVLVATTLLAAAGWLVGGRSGAALDGLSLGALALAGTALVVEGPVGQLLPWQLLGLLTGAAALARLLRPRRSRRWRRIVHRSVLGAGLLAGAVTGMFATVPTLPTPTGPFAVGSQTFTWTDPGRAETQTATPTDVREVVAQAWYPTDTRAGRATGYVGTTAPTSVVDGVPAALFRRYDRVDTHAVDLAPLSGARVRWPVLLFSPGLGVARQANTALCAELASRGYVVLALSHPYDSPATQLGDGRVVAPAPGVTTDMTGVPHQVDLRTADARFALTRLETLRATTPGSPLAGRLDLAHVGIFGHSLGGATAVQVLAADPRFRGGLDIDGRLPGSIPSLRQPFLWVQAGGSAGLGGEHDEMHRTRDGLLDRLAGGGGLVTVHGTTHLSFTDIPAYLTPLGRQVLGRWPGSSIGMAAVDDVSVTTADLVTSFLGPVLHGPARGGLADVAGRHPAVSLDRTVAPR